VSKAEYEASGFMEKKANELNGWKNGLTSRMFEGLDTATGYYVLQISAADYKAGNTLSENKASVVKNLGGETDYVTTDGIDITKATVVLDQTSYTYSANGITPKVKSITVDGTTISGDAFTKLFKVSKIEAESATVENSGKATAVITPIEGAQGQQYTGKVNTPAITITALDLSKADAYILSTEITSAGKVVTKDYNNGAAVQLTSPKVYAEGNSAPVKDADIVFTYSNNKNVGTATLTAYGKTNYTGSISTTFKIAQTAGTAPAFAAQNLTATSTTITAKLDADTEGVQYAISTKAAPSSWSWVDADAKGVYTFTGLTAGTTYYVVARTAATKNTTASAATAAVSATTTKGDLENAVVTLTKAGTTTAVDASTYTYNGSDQVPAVAVTLDGKTVDPSKYTVTYAYVKDGEDGKAFTHDSGDLTNAGTIRVIVSANGTDYSGTNKTKTYVINKAKLNAVVTDNGKTNEKTYDGKTAATLTTPKIVFTDPATKAAPTGQAATDTNNGTIDAANVTVELTSANVNAKQTIAKVVSVAGKNVLDNYDIAWDTSAVTVNVKKLAKVGFSTKAEGGSTFATAGEAATATYGSPLQLTVVNNANLPMTFTVPSEYKDYIEVSGDGVLTCKKFTALSSTIPVAVSVASVSNDNYDSTSTAAVYYNVSLAKAASEFAVTNNALTVNTSETEASIAKAIGAKITYKTKSTPTTDEATQTIDLDLGNAKLEYKTNNGVYTTGLPTAEGTYYVRITYTGTEADNLTVVVRAEAVTLTISKYAASLAGQGITEEEEPVKTGLVTDETSGVTYLYDENGKLVKSAFLSVDGKTYYANENGEVVKGKKVTVGGKGYVLDKDGVMLTGQLAPTQSGNQVYVGKDGVVVKNKVVTYKGKKYYATATGRIWTDGFKTTKFGNKVYANADGSLKVGVVFTVGKYKYYAGTSAAIATSGLTKTKSGNTVFATASGKLKVNTTFKYKGVKYKANKKGVVKKVK
jgi:hypothetical protein